MSASTISAAAIESQTKTNANDSRAFDRERLQTRSRRPLLSHETGPTLDAKARSCLGLGYLACATSARLFSPRKEANHAHVDHQNDPRGAAPCSFDANVRTAKKGRLVAGPLTITALKVWRVRRRPQT